jgi:beta-lactamase class A
MQTRIFYAPIIAVIFGAGIALGWSIRSGGSGYESVREASSGYSFIEPLLFVKVPEEGASSEYRPIKDALAAFAARMEAEKKVTDVSLYFRNLNTGQWVGVNSDEQFAPASMLKIVTLMGLLREYERDESLPNKKVRLPSSVPTAEQTQYPPKDPIKPGGVYTVDQLAEHLIVDSDNVANLALYTIVGDDKIMKIYDDFQLHRPDPELGYTTQEYSRLFRGLYNSTYLSRDLSEHILELLSQAAFDRGIVAGVPAGTVVSHKFGVRTVEGDRGAALHELHDCGIVYYPERPYFLCVMTRGERLEDLEAVLKGASAVAWEALRALR